MKASHTFSAAALCALLVFALAPSPARAGLLYDDLGGKPGITKVLVDMVGFIVDDSRINFFFAHANVPHLEGELVDLACAATGGPCTYTGKSMQAAHKGMHITEAQFNALVEDLEKSMDKNNIPIPTQNRFLRVLAPLAGGVDYQ